MHIKKYRFCVHLLPVQQQPKGAKLMGRQVCTLYGANFLDKFQPTEVPKLKLAVFRVVTLPFKGTKAKPNVELFMKRIKPSEFSSWKFDVWLS